MVGESREVATQRGEERRMRTGESGELGIEVEIGLERERCSWRRDERRPKVPESTERDERGTERVDGREATVGELGFEIGALPRSGGGSAGVGRGVVSQLTMPPGEREKREGERARGIGVEFLGICQQSMPTQRPLGRETREGAAICVRGKRRMGEDD